MKKEDKKTLPIGVLDSGLGGISVLRELVKLMPNENFIYYGDSKNAPYGIKSNEEILSLCENTTGRIVDVGIKAVVLACNTATSVAAEHLRNKYPEIPIIGEEPAIKPAVENSNGGTIVVMATNATLHGEKFLTLLNKYSDRNDIRLIPAPKLVNFVEKGVLGGEEVDLYLNGLFAPYRNLKIESVVLGCTHFPFLKKSVIKAVGYEVSIYDGGYGAACETRRRLAASGLLNDGEKGTIVIKNSLEGEEIIALSKRLLECEI